MYQYLNYLLIVQLTVRTVTWTCQIWEKICLTKNEQTGYGILTIARQQEYYSILWILRGEK